MTEPRDDSVYLSHIRDAIARVASYLEGISEREFMSTPLLQDGVIHQIQIIGEAAKVTTTWVSILRRFGIPLQATYPR